MKEGAVTKGCPFCHPQEQILLQTEHVQALLSDPRKVPGHIIVAPKRHIEKPWELTEQELQEIFMLVFKIEQRLIGTLGDGFDIRQNYRPFVAQNEFKIDHVIFHVIPRSNNDYIYSVVEKYEADLYAELDDLEREAVVKLLK